MTNLGPFILNERPKLEPLHARDLNPRVTLQFNSWMMDARMTLLYLNSQGQNYNFFNIKDKKKKKKTRI
jgi:hypothetical protein